MGKIDIFAIYVGIMSRDKYHMPFRRALEKENWLITHDPLDFSVGEVDFEIDLGAERIIGAEKDGRRIAIEIKSFLEDSPVSAFHRATGQYYNYMVGLSLYDPSRALFLAIPEAIYNTFFQRPFVKLICRVKSIKIITFDPKTESIVQWIET